MKTEGATKAGRGAGKGAGKAPKENGAPRTLAGKLREEFLHTTQTLWDNEVRANLFVARILIYTAAVALVIMILSAVNVFSISSATMARYLGFAFVELLVPALICIWLKGEKPWLKVLLMVAYVVVLARLQTVLGHNIVLCLVFPVALSVRYYSRPLTSFVSGLTVLCYIVSSYVGITQGAMRTDLNMVELPAGTVLEFPEHMLLRDAIDSSLIDNNQLFWHFVQHSFLPKLILFAMIAVICALIADRGRKAIYAQKAETEKTERLATELNLASAIQSNMLPNVFPVFPERKEFMLHASMTPAKEVGGDFYDFFFVDSDHIALVMADVSGKGMASNAGHEHPALRAKEGGYELVVYRHSPMLGVFEGMAFEEHDFRLEPGDSIFVYTDGVPEATNTAGVLMGTDRMLEALNKEGDAAPDQVLATVKDSIDAFAAGAEQFDDITMLSLKYYGPQAQ